MTTLTFSTQIGPKIDFAVRILRNCVRMQNQLLQDTMCANFQAKRTTLNFRPKFVQKRILGSEFQKIKSGCRSNSFKISCVPILRPSKQLLLFRTKFAQKFFWGWNFKILSLDSESAPPIYHECQFSGKMDNFEFLAQICPKRIFGVGISKL